MIATTIKTGARFQYEYEADTGKCKKTWGPKGLYAIELEIDQANRTTYVHGEEPDHLVERARAGHAIARPTARCWRRARTTTTPCWSRASTEPARAPRMLVVRRAREQAA